MRASFRNRVIFGSHLKVNPLDPKIVEANPGISFAWIGDDSNTKWISEVTSRISDYKVFAKSVYMRWAITINALHVARDRYASDDRLALAVDHLAMTPKGPEREHMVIWSGHQTAENYTSIIPTISAYAIQDMFGALEEIIFDIYETYINYNKLEILKGPDFRELRRLLRDQEDSPEKKLDFESAWDDRLDSWRRKKIYDGLHRVFKSFWNRAKLSRPSWYKETDVDDWAKTIELFSELRNLITHGEDFASSRLELLSNDQPFLGLKYVAGELLDPDLFAMMVMESFIEKFLGALNFSLMELGFGGPLPVPPLATEGGEFRD